MAGMCPTEGAVFRTKKLKDWHLSLGCPGCCVMGWPLTLDKGRGGSRQFLPVATVDEGSRSRIVKWEPILDWEGTDVMPTNVVSPVHQHLVLPKRAARLPGAV